MHQKVFFHLKLLKEKCQKECKTCKGQGCVNCAAMFDLYEKYAEANIPILYWKLGLKDLDPNGVGVAEVKKYCSKLDEAYEDGQGLFIFGKNGNGKTLSACAIGKVAIRQGRSVRFTFLGEIITSFMNTMYNAEARNKLQDDILNVDFLIIDDIDKAYLSEEGKYVNSIVDTLFRTRTQNCLPTIITANKSMQDILEKSKEEVFLNSLLSLFKESLLTICFYGGDKRSDLEKQAREKFLK